jgi:Ca2+-binding EF-hand superfamily protein
VHDHLNEEVQKYFSEFDKDANGWLDRKELREFLTKFFASYKIHFPVTDEYVDAVFIEIDANRDNKIQPIELQAYAMHFVNMVLPFYDAALKEK